MDSFQVYRDMKARTNGEIYIGVVGPVRTGKSTFIKRFMDLLVLPNMTDEHARARTRDELPQSASGTTIMTTEPKFVPKEAAAVKLSDDVEVKIRLIDCVGYMVEGASGHTENDEERQVKTPWFEYEIPFTKAAAIGTQKVIHDHSTIGFVVTTDGSVTGLPRENYVPAEEKTVKELQAIGKPFLILLNCQKPYTDEAKALKEEMEKKYGAAVVPVNCEQLKTEDIHEIMRQVLFEFPITEVEFYVPKWVEMLSRDHRIKQDLLNCARTVMDDLDDVRSIVSGTLESDSPYIDGIQVEQIEMDTGKVRIRVGFEQKYYYGVLSELTGGDTGAKEGTLSILVGGERQDYEACHPLFEAMGTNINYEGKAGSGQHCKLANQIMIAGTLSGVCEALTYAKEKGLDPDTFMKSVATGAAGSRQLDLYGPKIIAGDYAPGFFMKHFIKDMKLALIEANKSGIDLGVLSQVLANCEELEAEGCGELGTQALMKFYDEEHRYSGEEE